jgi:hypothetical protein
VPRRLLWLVAAVAVGVLFGVDRTSRGDTAGGFKHPGVVVTKPQLDFVKGQLAISAEPWTSAFNAAKTFPSDAGGDPPGMLGYAPHALTASSKTLLNPAVAAGFVFCGSVSQPDVHCTDEKEDGVAAYTQALLWYLSPPGPDKDTYGHQYLECVVTAAGPPRLQRGLASGMDGHRVRPGGRDHAIEPELEGD